jgi:hypothetical protein
MTERELIERVQIIFEGRNVDCHGTAGYPTVRWPEHPHAKSNGRVYVHLVVASRALGRQIPVGVEVHHAFEDLMEFRALVICEDRRYHQLLHTRLRVLRAGGDPRTHKLCRYCGLQPLENFTSYSASADGKRNSCRRCWNPRQRAARVGMPDWEAKR